jgi:hypothetical protein
MNERNLNEGQWEDRKRWSLGVGQCRKTFWNRLIDWLIYLFIYLFICLSICLFIYLFIYLSWQILLDKFLLDLHMRIILNYRFQK